MEKSNSVERSVVRKLVPRTESKVVSLWSRLKSSSRSRPWAVRPSPHRRRPWAGRRPAVAESSPSVDREGWFEFVLPEKFVEDI